MRKNPAIIGALIVLIGTVSAAVIAYIASIQSVKIPVEATQTAEALSTTRYLTSIASLTPPSLSFRPTSPTVLPVDMTPIQSGTPTPGSYSIRVEDRITGLPIPNAMAIVISKGIPFRAITDVNGIASFSLHSDDIGETLAILVDTDPPQYKSYYLNTISPATLQSYRVTLERAEPNTGSVTVHVVDSNNGRWIAGAKVLLLARGNTYTNDTDSNGIVSFELPFSIDGIQATISVQKDGETNEQTLTLLPEHFHRVYLNSESGTIGITSVPVASSFPTQPAPTPEESTPTLPAATTTTSSTVIQESNPSPSVTNAPPPTAIPDTPPPTPIPDTPPPSAIP